MELVSSHYLFLVAAVYDRRIIAFSEKELVPTVIDRRYRKPVAGFEHFESLLYCAVGIKRDEMSVNTEGNVGLEIGHVLFVDIVGYSKRLVNEQTALVKRLNNLVRSTSQFQRRFRRKLITIPTGDGMALVFFTAPDAPVRCAIELNQLDQEDPKIELRMGIHSGPVDRVADVNQRINVAGSRN